MFVLEMIFSNIKVKIINSKWQKCVLIIYINKVILRKIVY